MIKYMTLKPSRFKYIIFALSVIVEGLIMIELVRATERTLLQRILLAALVVLPFAVLFLVHKIWPDDYKGKPPTFRWMAFFTLLILLVIFRFSQPSLQVLLQFPSVDRAVAAGHGWLLPGCMLGIFIAFVMFKWSKKS